MWYFARVASSPHHCEVVSAEGAESDCGKPVSCVEYFGSRDYVDHKELTFDPRHQKHAGNASQEGLLAVSEFGPAIISVFSLRREHWGYMAVIVVPDEEEHVIWHETRNGGTQLSVLTVAHEYVLRNYIIKRSERNQNS